MIVIIGNYATKDGSVYNGQTGRTIAVTKGLEKNSSEKIVKIDTSLGYRNIANNIFYIIFCRRLVILPASKALLPLLKLLNFLGKLKVTNYVAIGGWLPDYIDEHNDILSYLKKMKSIHVQIQSMAARLNKKGLNNVYVLSNFREFDRKAIAGNKVDNLSNKTYNLVFYARVCEEKGIEILLQSMKELPDSFRLDIYGPVKDNYKDKFNSMLSECSRATYCGLIDGNAIGILSNYDCLVFPTHYEGEGFPGTILEAIYAEIPVVVSNWKYNKEIVNQYRIGEVVDSYSVTELADCIKKTVKDLSKVEVYKKNCRIASEQLDADRIIRNFIKIVGE